MFTGSHKEVVGYHPVNRRPSIEAGGWSNAYQAPQAISCRDFANRKPLPVAPAGPNAPDRRGREVGAQAGSALWLLSDPMGYRVLGPDGAPLAR